MDKSIFWLLIFLIAVWAGVNVWSGRWVIPGLKQQDVTYTKPEGILPLPDTKNQPWGGGSIRKDPLGIVLPPNLTEVR